MESGLKYLIFLGVGMFLVVTCAVALIIIENSTGSVDRRVLNKSETFGEIEIAAVARAPKTCKKGEKLDNTANDCRRVY